MNRCALVLLLPLIALVLTGCPGSFDLSNTAAASAVHLGTGSAAGAKANPKAQPNAQKDCTREELAALESASASAPIRSALEELVDEIRGGNAVSCRAVGSGKRM